MSIEAIAATGAGMAPPPTETVQAPPSASISDISGFQDALTTGNMNGAAAVGGPDAMSPALKAVFGQLESVNGEAKSIADYAKVAEAKGMEMTPGEVVNLTMRSHEFMFHCQLTSNIANRTSDGLQQLFRQQS